MPQESIFLDKIMASSNKEKTEGIFIEKDGLSVYGAKASVLIPKRNPLFASLE